MSDFRANNGQIDFTRNNNASLNKSKDNTSMVKNNFVDTFSSNFKNATRGKPGAGQITETDKSIGLVPTNGVSMNKYSSSKDVSQPFKSEFKVGPD